MIAVLILPGFPMGCLSSVIEPLRAACEIAERRAYRWQVVSETGAPVTCSAGIAFAADCALGDLEPPQALYVIASPQAASAASRATLGALRRLDRAGVTLGAFSGGVFALGRAGLLDGHRCSVHWCYEAAFRAAFPLAIPEDSVLTIDRRRETASGANAVFDLMLRRIADELDPAIMTEVACWFQHPMVRSEAVSQRRPAARGGLVADMLPAPVARAVAIFADNIETPVQIGAVARQAAVSERQLERVFKAATGLGPLAYYRQMRLNAARQLVLYSRDTLAEVAFRTGFSSAARMARQYRAAFGVTPDADRRSVDQLGSRAPLALGARAGHKKPGSKGGSDGEEDPDPRSVLRVASGHQAGDGRP